MRWMLIPLLAFLCAPPVHADELAEARKSAQAEVDAFVKDHPETGDYKEFSGKWAVGRNGWDDLFALSKDVEKLREEDWWLSFAKLRSGEALDEQRPDYEDVLAGLKATSDISVRAEKLLEYDSFVRPAHDINPYPDFVSIVGVFSLLEVRAYALCATSETTAGEKCIESLSALAAKSYPRANTMGVLIVEVVRSNACRAAMEVSKYVPDPSGMLGRILKLEPVNFTPHQILLENCAYSIAVIKDMLAKDDEPLKKAAIEADTTPVAQFDLQRRRLALAGKLLTGLPENTDSLSDPGSAEVLVERVEALHDDSKDDELASYCGEAARILIQFDIRQLMIRTLLKLRQLDQPGDSLEATKKKAAELVVASKIFVLRWNDRSGTLKVVETHPYHRVVKDDAFEMTFETLPRK